MSSILNKILKFSFCVVLCLSVCLCMTACTKNTKDIKSADQICVSGALYESFMYTLSDEEFVSQMVDIYNGLKYEKTDEHVDMMTVGETYTLTFFDGADTVTTLIFDSNNNCCFEAGGQAYKIVSDFDFGEVKVIIKDATTKVKESLQPIEDTKSTSEESKK